MSYHDTTARAEHELSIQLSAGVIDEAAGVIRRATVAQADVEATGKFILLDKDGNLTRNAKDAARKLQVVTDMATLTTLMASAQDAGGRLKVRSDHDDSLEKRAGFANNFELIPETTKDGVKLPARVVADINLNTSYRDRAIVLETARKTPELIGLSIDMTPSYEVFKDRALMRIDELIAVDIVDEGAITHDGLFLSRGVDKTPKVKLDLQPSENMASPDDKKEPTTADCMTAINAIALSVKTLADSVTQLAAAKPAADPAQLAAQKDSSEKLAALTESVANLAKQNAALGLKPGAAPAAGAEGESERARLAAEKDKDPAKKTYLELVEAEKTAKAADLASGKLKASDVHRSVMSAHPAQYREHLKAGGVYDSARDPMNASR